MIGTWCLANLHNQFGGELTTDKSFSGVSTDTRNICAGDLFVALRGPNFDAHEFIEQAVASGAVAVVVDHKIQMDVPQWVVPDTRIALGEIALANRQRFSGDLYAVTGSSGKTTVKEMLNCILSQDSSVLATKGNLNNDIGVPLTLFELSDEHQVAVIEQGASAIGEIGYTTALSLPDVAILNNAMGAHIEGFGSLQNIVEAKGEIFSELGNTQGTAVINLDDENAPYWLNQTEGQKRVLFSLKNPTADLFADDIQPNGDGSYQFTLHRQAESRKVNLNVMGLHNVSNALAATAAVSVKGLSLDSIVAGLESFNAVNGRMRPLKSAHGALLIDDSYNANPGSVMAAIDLLVDLPGESVLVLGDMAELGENSALQHEEVGCRAAHKGVGRLWATGALSRHTVSAYKDAGTGDGRHFEDKAALLSALQEIDQSGLNILIKGSRSAAMDQIVSGLVEGE